MTIENWTLINTQSITNPNYQINGLMNVLIKYQVINFLKEQNGAEIEFHVAIGRDIEDDIYTAITLRYLIKYSATEFEKTAEIIVDEMINVVRDAIDYHCYMINIDPSLLTFNSNFN